MINKKMFKCGGKTAKIFSYTRSILSNKPSLLNRVKG